MDGLDWRRRPMDMLAMLVAGFAARLFRLDLRRALGERGRLTLAGAILLIESFFEVGDALGEFFDDAIALDAPRA
jgi:hypothetical protein